MNTSHIHLLLNHFPIIGTLIGSAILLYSIIRKQSIGKATGTVIIIIMAVISIPVLLTGEPAEENIKHLEGISKVSIHNHEEASEKAFWLMEITGLISLSALLLYKIKSAFMSKAFVIAFASSVLTFFAMAWAGNLGGKIRHPEVSRPSTNMEKNQINFQP